MRTILIAGLLLSSLSARASGIVSTEGNTLLKRCEAESNSTGVLVTSGFCAGFILGATDALAFWSAGTAKAFNVPEAYCIPENSVTTDQLKRIVIKYLREHPEKLHLG